LRYEVDTFLASYNNFMDNTRDLVDNIGNHPNFIWLSDSQIDNHPNLRIGQTAEVGQSISRKSLSSPKDAATQIHKFYSRWKHALKLYSEHVTYFENPTYTPTKQELENYPYDSKQDIIQAIRAIPDEHIAEDIKNYIKIDALPEKNDIESIKAFCDTIQEEDIREDIKTLPGISREHLATILREIQESHINAFQYNTIDYDSLPSLNRSIQNADTF